MSDAKFASITSELLVRKGEAAPSLIAPQPMPAFEFKTKPPRAARKHHDDIPESFHDRKRRLVVTMSADQYVRLGIAAAKKDTTRHDLVQQACFAELAVFAREQAAECACLTSGDPCVCAEPADAVVSTPLAFTDS